MLVERFSKCDALHMTWVRFNAIRKAIPIALRIAAGQPRSDYEDIEMQKDRREWGLPQ